MKWIGLTGGIASGKSSVASRLKQRGYAVVDADLLAREVVKPSTEGFRQVVQAFGPAVVDSTGCIDRSRLAAQIFSNLDLRLKLEKITHPLIRKMAESERRKLESQGHAFAFYDVPLLFEKNLRSMFDAVVVVFASESTQRSRLLSRNKFTEDEIQKRLSSQIPLSQKLPHATYVVENNGSLDDLDRAVDELLKKLLHQAQE